MLTIHALDDVWIRIDCEDGIARELSDYFTFETPGATFVRRQQGYKHWDGRIRLFKLRTHTLYRGLLTRVIEFAKQRNYPVTNLVPVRPRHVITKDLREWYRTSTLPFEPRDYQYAALDAMLDASRGIVLSPTGSGKSYIIYLLRTLLAEHKTLVIVPTIGLVSQMTADFIDYGCSEDAIHQIQGGREKVSDKRIFVSTWQSLREMPANYFNQFGCVIVDEVHLAKAKSLTHIMEMCRTVPYRFGFTGTLDDTLAHRLILEGLFGDVTRVATTNELVQAKQLAPLRVKICVLKYPECERKNLRHYNYADEVGYVVQNRARTEFIAEMVSKTKGNTLVLFTFIEKQGLQLFERIKAKCGQKTCHYIAGSVEGDDRERIRQLVEQGEDQVIVASYGTFSTGVNITNLRNLVFAAPSKSKYRVLQSIGRTLRTHKDKAHATLYDIVDDLRIGKHINTVWKHAEKRIEYYGSEKFPIQLYKISLEEFARQCPSSQLTSRDNVSVNGPSSNPFV